MLLAFPLMEGMVQKEHRVSRPSPTLRYLDQEQPWKHCRTGARGGEGRGTGQGWPTPPPRPSSLPQGVLFKVVAVPVDQASGYAYFQFPLTL